MPNRTDIRDVKRNDALRGWPLHVEVSNTWESLATSLGPAADCVGSSPFMDLQWLRSWWDAFGQGRSLHCYVFKDARDVVGFLPLYEERDGSISYLRVVVGHGWYSLLLPNWKAEYAGPILQALIADLQGRSNIVLDLIDVPDRTPLSSFLRSPTDENVTVRTFKLYSCPVARLGSSWEAFFNTAIGRKKKQREFKKFERKISEIGHVEFEVVRDPISSDTCKRLIAEIRELHHARFTKVWNRANKERSWSFYHRLLHAMLGRGLTATILRVDGLPLSFLLGYECDNTFVDWMPAFHPAFEIFSPGHVHIMKLTRWLIQNGFEQLDFSKGDELYKKRWSQTFYTNERHLISFNLSIRRRLLFILWCTAYRAFLLSRELGWNRRLRKILGTVVRSQLPQRTLPETVKILPPGWHEISVGTLRQINEGSWPRVLKALYKYGSARLRIACQPGIVLKDEKTGQLLAPGDLRSTR